MDDFTEGNECELKVEAKGARGEGIGKCGDLVVMVRDAKTRIGNVYKVKFTKVYRTFAYAELMNSKQQFVAGSPVDFS
jgi:predicted RNA-binding protein with TRAM domain